MITLGPTPGARFAYGIRENALRLSAMMQGDRRGKHRSWIALSAALLWGGIWASMASIMTGCGAPAAPLPPTLNLPQPVHDLSASRAGDTVHVTFSVPQKTTDKLPVRGPMTAKLCRSVDAGPCQSAGTLAIPALQKSASMDDSLPAALTQGSPRLLTYKLSMLNHGEKSYGESGPAYAVAGIAPAPVTGFSAMPRRKGIVLSWQGIGVLPSAMSWVQFDRTRTSGPPSQPSVQENSGHNPLSGHKTAEEPVEQVFRVPDTDAAHPPFALDATAHTGNSYRYTAQRIQQVTVAGHTMDIASQPSPPAETAYRDVFPPPVPVGLVSASDTNAKAIDLNWTPDVDPALAGYIVYRRTVGTNEAPQRISPAGKPVTTSEWSDTTAIPGQRYAYSVSAIDVSGNESQRSTEVEDGWSTPAAEPNPQPVSLTSPQTNPHP
jgi:hypothetical protein